MMPRFSRPGLVLVAVMALSGCNEARIPMCPGAAILADAAWRPALKPGGAATDPASLLYSVRATGITTDCTLDKQTGEVDSNVEIDFRATRAPSGQAAHYTVPYFLAINQGERLINKRLFNVQIDFAPGASSVIVQTPVRGTALKLENGHLPTDYQFLAGFPLSADEQAYLKIAGPYAP